MLSLFAVSIPSSLPNFGGLSTDAIIAGLTLLVVVYGLIGGYGALVREVISVYVGLVLASTFAQPVLHYAKQGAGASFPITITEVKLVLLILPIVLLQFGRKHSHGHAEKHNIILTLVIAVLAAMLIVSSVLQQLSDLALSRTTNASMLASWIYDFRLVWLAAVPIAIAASALIRPRHHR